MSEYGAEKRYSEEAMVQSRRVTFEDAEDLGSISDARIIPQLDFLNDQFKKTQAMFSELTQRLDPILLPERAENINASDGPVPRKLASDLSNTIEDLNNQIGRLQVRIDDVLRRIQL